MRHHYFKEDTKKKQTKQKMHHTVKMVSFKAQPIGDNIKIFHFGIGIGNEPKTLGELFRELECELEALVISMQLFIQILSNIADIENVVKENKDLLHIIAVLRVYTRRELGFMCES